MELYAAFLLGLAGSLHCAAMCGPLALAVPVVGSSKLAILLSRTVYNGGRVATYVMLGLVSGTVGKTLALAGLQRSLSIGMGSIILLIVLLLPAATRVQSLTRLLMWVKQKFAFFLQERSYAALLALGLLNGLLPCGLVYAAAAGAVTTGSVTRAAEFMAMFGLGTLPMMLGLGLLGARARFRLHSPNLVRITTLVMGTLLILRGLGLGIPMVSPAYADQRPACCVLHKPL
jgi:sulfite exporter TauE/SafE